MVLKINKLYVFLTVVIMLSVSFIFAVRFEAKTETTSAAEYIKVPIIMYHHLTENENESGNYTITVNELESDIKHLIAEGYTTVLPRDLINYVYYGESLPDKPILLTFDDGFESYYALAKPIFENYNIRSSVFIIGATTDLYTKLNDHNLRYSNLNWNQIKDLASSPLFEIGSHTYDMHHNEKGKRKGMSRQINESVSDYSDTINADNIKLCQRFEYYNIRTPVTIAYPYGAYDSLTSEIVGSLGFKISLTCEERINSISKGKPECLFNLGRYNRVSGISSEEFFNKFKSQGQLP